MPDTPYAEGDDLEATYRWRQAENADAKPKMATGIDSPKSEDEAKMRPFDQVGPDAAKRMYAHTVPGWFTDFLTLSKDHLVIDYL